MTTNPNVAERTPVLPARLTDVADGLLEEARGSDDGAAAITLTPATGGQLAQTVVALRAEASLQAARWNGPATVQVLTGRVRVEGGDGDRLDAGTFTIVDAPDAAVVADGTDAALLLTVAPGRA
jgi:redox-sensitive bicupin YhaK (pirin superfamily)